MLVAVVRATKQGEGQMFETLFGAETPLAVRFFFAFFVMLVLFGATAWAVRRLGTARLGGGSSRGRRSRLAVIDTASVDGRRRLILVRRDSVEHLLMIGGPIDMVIEPNIVRTVTTPHDVAVSLSPAAAEPPPRTIPLPDKRSWPQQSEPAATPRPASQIEQLPEEPAAWPLESHAELSTRARPDALATLADEFLTRRIPPPGGFPGSAPARLSEPRGPIELAAANSALVDSNLAKLALHIEAALRVPNTPAEPREAYTPIAPAGVASQAVEHAAATAPRPQSHAARIAEPKSRLSSPEAALYGSDSLAREMANLLGRGISKT
jgi:flagellar biogenesis protein FliO